MKSYESFLGRKPKLDEIDNICLQKALDKIRDLEYQGVKPIKNVECKLKKVRRGIDSHSEVAIIKGIQINVIVEYGSYINTFTATKEEYDDRFSKFKININQIYADDIKEKIEQILNRWLVDDPKVELEPDPEVILETYKKGDILRVDKEKIKSYIKDSMKALNFNAFKPDFFECKESDYELPFDCISQDIVEPEVMFENNQDFSKAFTQLLLNWEQKSYKDDEYSKIYHNIHDIFRKYKGYAIKSFKEIFAEDMKYEDKLEVMKILEIEPDPEVLMESALGEVDMTIYAPIEDRERVFQWLKDNKYIWCSGREISVDDYDGIENPICYSEPYKRITYSENLEIYTPTHRIDDLPFEKDPEVFLETKLTDFIKKVKKAKEVAKKYHAGQKRFGAGEDYIIHPNAVAKILHKVKSSHKIADLIAACYLHDTIEDTELKHNKEYLRETFGDLVLSLVEELTSNEDKMKLMGKENYLIDKMLNMSSWGLVIKLCDRLDNVSDIPKYLETGQPELVKWAKKYANQTKNIIHNLEEHRELSETQKKLIEKIKRKIENAT
jgi:hypothetical protein